MSELFNFKVVETEIKKISEKESKQFYYDKSIYFSIKEDEHIEISKGDDLIVIGEKLNKSESEQEEIRPSIIYNFRNEKIVYGGMFDLITFLVPIFIIVILIYIHPRAMVDLSLDGSLLILFFFILFTPIVVRDFIKNRYMLYKYLKAKSKL